MKFLRYFAATLFLTTALPNASGLPPSVPPDYEIWLSGTGFGGTVLRPLLPLFCVPGTVDSYASSGFPGQVAVFCQLDSARFAGGLSTPNPNVLIHLRNDGGNATGVRPVCDKSSSGGGTTAIEFLAIDSSCTLTGPNVYDCPAANVEMVEPDAGFSGLAPSEYPAGVGSDDCDAVRPWFGRTLRVVANSRLRNALQVQQGLTVGAEDVANQPTIARGFAGSVLAGLVQTWDQVPCLGGTLSDCSTGLIDSKVKVCRRVDASEAHGQSRILLLGTGCVIGALAPVGAPGNPFGGPEVVENSSAVDLANCLQAAQDDGEMALGVEDRDFNAALAFDYRTLSINGAPPIFNSVATGAYETWTVNTLQWRFPFVNDANRADIVSILEQVVIDGGSSLVLSALGLDNGVIALSQNGCASGEPLCSLFDRRPTGGALNCAGPLFWPE